VQTLGKIQRSHGCPQPLRLLHFRRGEEPNNAKNFQVDTASELSEKITATEVYQI